MKHFYLIIALGIGLINYAQSQSINSKFKHLNEPYKEWMFGVGVNAVVNLGERNPVYSPSDWAIKHPLSVSAEKGFSPYWALELNLALNGYDEGDKIDGLSLAQDETYFSFDAQAKYYFGKHIFSEDSWFDMFATAGPGYFVIDESNLSFNLGGGLLFWLNDNHRLGVKLQTVGKFAVEAKDYLVDNNHFQHHLQVVFKL